MFKHSVFIALLGLLLLAGAGYFVWPLVRPAPAVVQPANPAALDPPVASLIRNKVMLAQARPRAASAHGELGLAYEANLLWDEAVASYRTAVRLAPDDPGWRLHLALATRQAGDFDAALRLLRALAADVPFSAAVQQRLGMALAEQGALDEAAAAFRQVITLAPELPHGYVGLGDVLLQQDDATQARVLLERAVALAPDYRMAHYLLGQAYQRLGYPDVAEQALARGVNATPWFLPDPLTERVQGYAVNLTARLDEAGAYLNADRPEEAARVLEQVRDAHPDNVAVRNNLAIAYLRQGRLDEAHHLLRSTLALDTTRFSTYLNLVAWAERAQQFEQALTYADGAVAQAPSLAQPHFARGQVLARLGRLEEALTSLQKAIEYDAAKPEPYTLSGDLLLRMKRYDEAFQAYQQAVERGPNLFPAQIGLARAAATLGRRAEAEAALAAARRLAPDHPLVAQTARQLQTLR